MFQGEKPTERRSLPPERRSPGPRKLQEVKSQVGKLQQDRDPFPFKPVVPYSDDDEDDYNVVEEPAN
jgi:hypothetical protein